MTIPPSSPWDDPTLFEHTCCPLCDAGSSDVVVVGTRARFGMAVRNVACARCGLVRIDPRPTPAAMDAYYRGPYREQYRSVKLPTATGALVGPDDPGYLEARRWRYEQQARILERLVQPAPGERVLEVGCRDGQTLANLSALAGVEVFGVEPGPAEAAQARARGVDVFVGLLEEFTPEAPFDVVQMFHVLEHLHEPAAALRTLASWLRPGGRLVLEVPNVEQPYGPLEGNFFQNAHLYNFSANTLCGLLRRAGLEPMRMIDGGTLFVTGVRAEGGARPFGPDTLDRPSEDGAWIAARLDTYRHVERLRRELLSGQASMDKIASLAGWLTRPAFPAHTHAVMRDVLALFGRAQATRAALAVVSAAALGPHPEELVAHCARLTTIYRNQLGWATAA